MRVLPAVTGPVYSQRGSRRVAAATEIRIRRVPPSDDPGERWNRDAQKIHGGNRSGVPFVPLICDIIGEDDAPADVRRCCVHFQLAPSSTSLLPLRRKTAPKPPPIPPPPSDPRPKRD